jgi:hypothetical protein
LLVLFTGQQDIKQPTDTIVGAVYWTAGYQKPTDTIVGAVYWTAECQTANTPLLVLFTGQQNVKQPTDTIVGAVYRTAECQTANRHYCWCCLQDNRMSNSQQTLLLVLFAGQQNVKQQTDTIGAVYRTAECQTTNRHYCWCCLLDSRMSNSQQTLLLVLFTGQQNVKQPTDTLVGNVYRTAVCQTANRRYCWCCLLDSRMSNSQQTLLLVLFTGQQNVKQPTDYCWCCLQDSRMSNSQQTLLLVLFTFANQQEVLFGFK